MRKQKMDERGMVSIIVTMILILVMTLVVLGMSRNSVREQRQSLDRQLSDQAYYNAETGINDWVKYLYENPSLPRDKTDCNDPSFASQPVLPPSPTIDENNSYTCVLYDKAPNSIIVDSLGLGDARTFAISSDSIIKDLVISWGAPSGVANDIGTCTYVYPSNLPSSLGSNCNVGGVRFDLIEPGLDQNSNGTQQIRDRMYSAYLLPSQSSNRRDLSFTTDTTNAQGVIGVGACSNSNGCTVTLSNLNLPANYVKFLHIKPLYVPNISITVTGLDSSNQPVRFPNSQYMLDVTGRSADVLRRISVRIDAQSQYNIPDNSLRTADSICKLISVDKDRSTATLDQSGQCAIN